jgi:hypothetical protein
MRLSGGWLAMAQKPTAAEIRAYAEQQGLTDEQAHQLLAEHGHDAIRLSEALESLKHFLKAPS